MALTARYVNGCNSGLFTETLAENHETHISTVHYTPQAHSRISCADENSWWPRSGARPPRQGALTSGRLIRATNYRGKGARRLEGAHAYAPVFAFKCRVVSDQFQVYGKPNEAGVARLGIVVSKQVMPRAVDRNYCKRFVREVFRQEHEVLHGFDFVVRLHSGEFLLPAAARAELRKLLLSVLRKCRGRNPVVDYG